MQNDLSTHPAEGAVHKTETRENTQAVAEAALKNIPGSQKLIAKTFNKTYTQSYFPVKKHVNLEMHQGWGYGHQ
jgi:hypothetical protein